MPLVEPEIRVEQSKLSYRCRKDTAAVVERLLVLPDVRFHIQLDSETSAELFVV